MFNGSSITYDEIGNPTNHLGMPMTWENGRQLKNVGTGSGTYLYTYNSTGTRIGKTGGNLNVQYILNGSQVARQIINGNIVDYLYHENGTPMAFAMYNSHNDILHRH